MELPSNLSMTGWILFLQQSYLVITILNAEETRILNEIFFEGKPSAADLSLGLATAPVLFASEQYPELNKLILRRFSNPGDVETAFQLVCNSEGLQQTRLLANKYKDAAMDSIKHMDNSSDKEKLSYIAEKVISRMN